MSEDQDIEKIEGVEPPLEKRQNRRSDGGVYLVVADSTPEFQLSLRYAARLALANRGHVGILEVMDSADFQHWGSVEDMMRNEMREQAEKSIWNLAKSVNELNGIYPVLHIGEGGRNDVLLNTINNDMTIRMLILGGGTGGSGPGALVSHFTGKGLGKLRVPVMVVPGNLAPDAIDALT